MTMPRANTLSTDDRSLSLRGFGTARADLAAIAGMRKSLPEWVPPGTPGHFLKHADEQTVLAVAALDQAICSLGLQPKAYSNWAIIAAPRFIGRIAGTVTLDRFARGGGPAISPHLIPQHSLHSISGSLSILLASRQPNVGVGGASDSLAEGLLTALTFPAAGCRGAWVVCTGWEPEPQLDDAGHCQNSPACHAVALALESTAAELPCGRLHLMTENGSIDPRRTVSWFDNAAGLCQALASLTPGGQPRCFAWRLGWGATIVLEAQELVAGLEAAA